MNILIVDDEVMIVSLIKKHVNWAELGISEVLTAYNVQDAKRKVRECRIDILVCDIEMPQENGLALLAWIKRYDPSIISVILTAYPDFLYAQTAISLGVKKYMLKPVSFNEFSATIQAVIKEIEEKRVQQQASEDVPEDRILWNKRAFYVSLLLGDISPSMESIQRAAREGGLSPETLEPKAIVYIRVQGAGDHDTPDYTLKNTAEEMYPDIVQAQVWENIYWILPEESRAAEIRECCARFVKKTQDATGWNISAYYLLHVKLTTLSACAYHLRHLAQAHHVDGQNVYDADKLIEATAAAGKEPDMPSSRSIAEDIMDYIHMHYTEPIGRLEIEESLHMNGDYLNRIFKEITGYSLIQYIQYYRILASKRLMSEDHMTVSEASGKVGFDSPSYFSKIFKKWTNITPYEFYTKIHRK